MLDSDMSDRKSTLPQDPGQPLLAGAPASLGRRRFAKGAAPVLLGTLASKPVLGADLYFCTISGQMSGNASAHDESVVCPPGDDVATWTAASSWPGSYEKGVLPATISSDEVATVEGSIEPDGNRNKDKEIGVLDAYGTRKPPTASACGSRSGSKGTPFNGTHGLAPTFYISAGSCDVGTTAVKGAEASMLQVLSTTDSSELFRLGRAVVVSLLNEMKYPGYPVSQARIVEMFNAVRGGGTYHVGGANLDVTRLGVIEYLEKLYS